MASWQFISCDDSKLPNIYNDASAVMALDGAIYFHQGLHDKHLYRNRTPKNPDTWELVTNNCYIGHDPFMYYDEIDDRVWASYGCGVGEEEYIKVVELDRHTLEPSARYTNASSSIRGTGAGSGGLTITPLRHKAGRRALRSCGTTTSGI